jgi:type II secretory pathway pseudopilin PulG
LVEIMVVVVMISLLAALAVPTMQRIQRKARSAAIANDFRVFASAFQSYAHTNGSWPAEAAAGVVPPEMADILTAGAWGKVTPIGGTYNWDNSQLHQGGFRPKAAISVVRLPDTPVFDANQLRDIDTALDDGNLATGTFRLGSGNGPVFVIEE